MAYNDALGRKQNSIFKRLFDNLYTYFTTKVAFTYNELLFVVDFKISSLDLVNPNIVGTYYVTETQSLYDEESTLITVVSVHDKITIDDIDYFLDESLILREIGSKYNNTVAGQYGLTIYIGDVYDENTLEAPCFYFVYDNESYLSPLERVGVDLEKTLAFDISFITGIEDVYGANDDYKDFDFYSEYFMEMIYDYYNDCSILKDKLGITEWFYNKTNVGKKRPLIKGIMENTLTYI